VSAPHGCRRCDAELLTALPVDRDVASAFATLVVEMRAAGHGKLGVQDA
jgi:hypothetical protein